MSDSAVSRFNLQDFREVGGAWIAVDAEIEEGVIILPGAVVGRPPISVAGQSRKPPAGLPPVRIGKGSVVGCGSVLYRGSAVDAGCLLGDGCKLREGVVVGEGTILAMGVTVNYGTRIGASVKVMDNSHLTGEMVIEDGVFISTLVSTTNDNSMGRVSSRGGSAPRTGPTIRRNATVGAGASLLPGVEIGEDAMVGAGSVVTRAVPARTLVMGVPARVVRPLRDDELKS